MKKLFCATTILWLSFSIKAQHRGAKEPEVITGTLIRTTKPLKNFTKADEIRSVKVRNKHGIIGMEEEEEQTNSVKGYGSYDPHATDPALQKSFPKRPQQNSLRAIVQNFNGIGNAGASPADPTLCVGPNHIIQMVNGASGALLQVFDKAGNILIPAKNLDAITGKGGLGDGIALYDQLADRFILTEIVNSFEAGSEGLAIAVSQTGDPTGAWFVYFFSTGINFPDYPKFSVWSDALYATSRDFANRTQFIGCSVYAFDRGRMLAGDATASVQKFLIGSGPSDKEQSMCPVLFQGNTLPPAGTGGLIAYMNDNNWSGSSTDSIGLFEFKVNFSNPAVSSLTTRASLAVSPYVPFVGFNFGQAATQPGSTLNLDVIQQRIMNQPIYRNFGNHEGIVLTHVVDQGAQIAGLRWYELQKTTTNWSVKNQSTFGPDNTFRFVPSIGYDAAGNIGLAYNVSSAANNVFPGARYTGRSSCDAPNSMTLAENELATGTAANGSNRWGDYNHLVCDPDGIRLWFTSAYNNSLTWNTRISSFTLDNCVAALCGDPNNLAVAGITDTSATVSWTSVPNAVSYDIQLQLDGTGSWTTVATAITATTFKLNGLAQNNSWKWQVRANCAAGAGNFIIGPPFTTLAVCNEILPTDLFSFELSADSVGVSWIPRGISEISYDVEYKLNTSATWLSAGNTTSTFVILTGLLPNSLYDWRVKTRCTGGLSSIFAASQFTSPAPVCPSPYDNVPNGNFNNAQAIPLSTDIFGKINRREDDDFYKFVLPGISQVSISLTTLPANYDISLYKNNRQQIASSEKRGTANELIRQRLPRGTYYIKVSGKNDVFNANNCYTLKVSSGASTNSPEITMEKQFNTFPNPVTNTLNVILNGSGAESFIQIFDAQGKLWLSSKTNKPLASIDVSKLVAGIYFIKINDAEGNSLHVSKFVKR